MPLTNLLSSLLFDIPRLWGWLGFLFLLFLPGAWISFGLRLSDLSFWPRLFTGLMLSCFVVLPQFGVIKLLGASFETTSYILVLVNLPALYLIVRCRRAAQLSDRRNLVLGLSVIAVCVLSLASPIAHPERRMYFGHTLLYTDAAYAATRGGLVPEDPEFAGESLAYPVPAELVYSAVLGYSLKSTPATSFIWPNLVWMIATCGFAIGLVRELGGEYMAQLAAAPCLLFGINPLGHWVGRFLPRSLSDYSYRVWGDVRFNSWMLKYIELNTMPVVLGMLIATAYLLLRFRSRRLSWDLLLVLALLLGSIGTLYPILFPPACALIGASCVVAWWEAWTRSGQPPWRRTISLAVVLLVAAIATAVQLEFLIQGRKMAGGAVHISSPMVFLKKVLELQVTLTPLLAGFAVVWRRCWERHSDTTVFLLLGAMGSAVLYPIFFLPYYSNEYKYVFTTAMFLAPFAALAMGHVAERLPRWAAVVVIGTAVFLSVAPYASLMYAWDTPAPHPATDIHGFYLRLDDRERLAGICDAIRTETPPDTLLVIVRSEVHFPTITNRTLYAPPIQTAAFAGVYHLPDTLLVEIRGYSSQELNARRSTVNRLFKGNARERAESLRDILRMKRPVAILIEPQDEALLLWLRTAGKGAAAYQNNGLALWLIPAPGTAQEAGS